MPLGGRFWAWFSRSGETPARPHRMNGHATRRLRIAIVAPPYYSVPPTSYGGIELMCHVLIEGLVDRGHDITLIAVGEARTRARFIQTFAEPQQEATANDAETEIIHAALAASALAGVDVDVVHDHTRAGPLTAASRRVPTIVTVHAALSGPDSHAEWLEAVARWICPVAISEAQRRDAPHLNWAATVHHGIPVDDYPFRAVKEDYVVYLGRLSPHKGAHLAIDAARAAGRRIVIAGGATAPSEAEYLDREVRPRLGPGVEWIGEVGPPEKKRLLAGAACLLCPVLWHEPFGLAVIEAMACGTPVVCLRAGALPELVTDRETGVVCDSPSELAAAIEEAAHLEPWRCRDRVRRNFSTSRMVRGYESLYCSQLDSMR